MAKKKNPASELGKMGGEATSKKYGPDHYRKLQKASIRAKKRNSKKNI